MKRLIGLSKEILYFPLDQGTAKLHGLKVCAVRDPNPVRPESSESLYKLAKNVTWDQKDSEFYFDC